ncbi:hypothetical protein LCGC14_1978180 [marine sediment metagenome]|uniref:Uncharacterized protein n=1 Tax=marine sediment metagenome TaxID=412755 RepID=A0A0F9F9N3_9ZZZZ
MSKKISFSMKDQKYDTRKPFSTVIQEMIEYCNSYNGSSSLDFIMNKKLITIVIRGTPPEGF